MNSSGTRGKRRRSEKLERTKWRFNWKSRRTEQSSRSFPLYPLLYPLPVFSFALSPSLSLSLVYRRFLCLRVSPCTSSIHTISRLAWRSSASISCPPSVPPPLPPHPCIPPSLPPALRVPFYIKIRALKTRRYTKSTPWPLLHPARHHLFSSCLTSLLPSSSSSHFSRSYHRRCSFFSSSRSTAANNPRLRSSGGMEEEEEEEGEEEEEEEWRGIGAITAAGTRSLSHVDGSLREGTSSNRLRRLFFTARGHDALLLLLLPPLGNYLLHAGVLTRHSSGIPACTDTLARPSLARDCDEDRPPCAEAIKPSFSFFRARRVKLCQSRR